MEERTKKTYINRKLGEIKIKEYNYNDILNLDNSIGKRKINYLDSVLRKRLTHITFSVDSHPKSSIIKSMGIKIYFEWIKIIIEELFNCNKVHINRVGNIFLHTRISSTKYKGYPQDVKRSKNKGIYTIIECEYDSRLKNLRYRRPFWAFGKHYKTKIRNIEDTGFKF